MLSCLSLYCFMIFGPPGVALSAAPATVSTLPGTSIHAFGHSHPECRAWTDGCTSCAADAGGKALCSIPGIACTPGAAACSQP